MAVRKRGPFSMVYGPWLNEWSRANLGRTQLLVMLKLCERLEFDDYGHAYAWYPRGELASELGLTENAVRVTCQRLKELGMLKVQNPGHKGRATVYMVMPSIPWRDSQRVHADVPPNDSKGAHNDASRVHTDVHPLRHKDGGGTADADRRPDIGPANSFWEAAVNAPDRDEFERRHDEAERLRRAGGLPE